MASFSMMDKGVIESIAKIFGDTTDGFTGSEIAALLNQCNIPDLEPTATKWRRLNAALQSKQYNDKCANNVINLIQTAMMPARHIKRHEWFNNTLVELNRILSFEGYKIGDDGKIRQAAKATTISEAKSRADKLKQALQERKVHSDVLEFCKEELLVDNYFHAVFEATKSIMEKIRVASGLSADGGELVDEAFGFKDKIPHLALNSLETESQKSEQRGFMNLIKGIHGTYRNQLAHNPKIAWSITEQDALDILSMISLIHRRLDTVIMPKKLYYGV